MNQLLLSSKKNRASGFKKTVPAFIFACATLFAIDASAVSIMRTHVPEAVASGLAPRVSTMATAQHLKLALNLPLRNEADLDSLLQQLQDPQSPNYQHYLSVQEFTDRFGPTQQDYDAVVAWAQVNGLKVTGTPANRRLVDVEGSVDAINRALHVQIGNYRHTTENRTFFAPDREPTVDLGVPLLKITGLTNVTLPHNHLLHKPAAQEQALATVHLTGSGPSGEYLPSDMRAAYYGSGSLTGAGQTVGIFSYDGYISSDVTLFYSKTGMKSSVPIQNVLVNGYSGVCDAGDGSGTSPCDDGEQILDIVNVIGMAPGLSKVVFYEGSSATDILNQMATDNTAKVLSCSWGGGDFGSADDPIYKQFAAQGQTFLNATGDSGAYTTSNWSAPSLDPNILDVGATDLVTTGPGGGWSSETAWVDSSGGFLSQAGYSIPAYQKLAGVVTTSNKASKTLRNDPDVAAEGNFDNPTVSNGSFLTGYGGTSFAAPRWAGFLALVNQQAAAKGKPTVGFVNTKIYNLGLGTTYHSLFHDITRGNNGKFNAVSGFDLVTGWGSPSGAALINALTQ
ncbi:S53 family peptidase [Dyella tabacisoli]|uniref:S53 family peptidase n=1 Tax=Dyella tabacisoli TaxID=2282381 RepID=UPI0013B3C46C|nr:S53 family peptidase [Dyella tabacisoli]